MPSSTSSDYLFAAEMNYLLKGTAYTSPSNIYVALFTTTPGLNGSGGSEISTAGSGYARVAVPTNTGWTGPNASLEWSNTNDIVFGVPTSSWGTIVSCGLYDALTGGNLLSVSPMTVSKVVSSGDGAPRILAGQLVIKRASC